MKLGKTYRPEQKADEIIRKSDRIQGPTWSIAKDGSTYVFSYLSGELSGRFKTAQVTKSDFDAIFSGDMTDYDLMLKYGLS